jgi:hypothetical protein
MVIPEQELVGLHPFRQTPRPPVWVLDELVASAHGKKACSSRVGGPLGARLVEAATKMAGQPVALQLRFLQAVIEVATEQNSMVIVPVPIDLLTPFPKRPRRSVRGKPA